MSRDIEIALAVLGQYAYLPRAEAVTRVSEELGLTRSGVSGMVTRAENTIDGRLAIMRYRTNKASRVSYNDQRLQTLTDQARSRLQRHRDKLPSSDVWAVWLSDIHFPKQRMDALHLAYEVISHIPGHIGYISVLNDGLDFVKISQWNDRRSLSDQQIDVDLWTQIDLHNWHIQTLRKIAPKAALIALPGNHEIRLATHGIETGLNPKLLADFAETLVDNGVILLNNLKKEPIFRVSPGLIWSHGWFARKNRENGLTANYAYALHELNIRETPDFIMGHTHCTAYKRYHNANLYNAGCLCNLQPDYMRRVPDWNLGMVISKIDPTTSGVETYNLKFYPENGRLRTSVGFREFSVPVEVK